jgi:hypothetical protein
VDVFGRRATFHTSCRAGTGRAFEFASLNKPTMAAFFHVNSSLVAGHNWRRPQLRSTELRIHVTNSSLS